MNTNKYWESFCCEEVFSRFNWSENYVQVLSRMHFNVQLLYLPLFFAFVVGVAVLIA